MIINNSEMEDFNNAILSKGFDPSDFEVIELENPMRGVDVQPITGQIKVIRKFNGVNKTYKAGHMSHWTADFVDDLKGGLFD
jgi:hypothetical protein